MSTKIVILDFDGTLADTTGVILNAMQATIKELGLPARTDKECIAMIGLRLDKVPAVLFPECDLEGELYAQTYRKMFHLFNTEGAVTLYPNVVETLTALKEKGIILTIASSRNNVTLKVYLENLGLDSVLDYVLGGDDVKEGKPNPEAVFRTLEEFGIAPEEAIVVGDTVFDVKMGLNAGTRACGVTFGNGTVESLADADWIIDDFAQLLDIVTEN